MKFCEKNVLCEKGDEITRFDGTYTPSPPIVRCHILVLVFLTNVTIVFL
jgi:hypothetical protein